MSFKIYEKIKTKQEVENLLLMIDEKLDGGRPRFPDWVKEEVKDGPEGWGKLKERLESLPVFSLTIAFEPTEEFRGKLANWIKENVEKKAVLDLKIDKEILGGAIISWQGKYRNYSLSEKLKKNNE